MERIPRRAPMRRPQLLTPYADARNDTVICCWQFRRHMVAHSANDSNKTPEKGIDGQPAVLIVGAGPTGLLLASELQRRRMPCHLIDSRPAPMHWDRATVVHPRSLQIFESLGLAQKFLDAGCRQRAVKIHSNGKLLGKMELSSCGSSYGVQRRPLRRSHRIHPHRVSGTIRRHRKPLVPLDRAHAAGRRRSRRD